MKSIKMHIINDIVLYQLHRGSMSRLISSIGFAVALLSTYSSDCAANEAVSKPVRVAVIGGMTMTPLWDEIPIFIPLRSSR